MQTVKLSAPAADAAPLAETMAVDRSIIMREQSALFSTRLALARWTGGGDIPHLRGAAIGNPVRAGWYVRASRDFQEWIEGGGFAQHDEAQPAGAEDRRWGTEQPGTRGLAPTDIA
jgi:hypothetical protein